MNEGNQKVAICGAILTVVVAIGLSVWYAGSLEAEDDMEDANSAPRTTSPGDRFRQIEGNVSEPDENGDVQIQENEVDYTIPKTNQPQRSQQRWQ